MSRGDAGKPDAGCIPVTAGHALSFDNTSQPQYVTIPDAPKLRLTTAITIEAWISELDTSFNCIVCKPYGTGTDDSIAVWFQSGPLYWGLNVPTTSGALNATWPGTSGTWHHVAATYDGTTQEQRLFIDGIMVGVLTGVQGAPTYDNNPLLIGSDINSGGFSLGFKGTIDEVRLFSAARTVQQIAADMAGTCSPVGDPTLVAYYPFNEGSGTVAHDSSGNHLDGTLGLPDAGTGASPTWAVSTVPF
jgi:hypothetical protein